VGQLIPHVDAGLDIKKVTLTVNGGYNGLKDRERYYRKTLDVI
jgi:predicted chitinase